MKEHHHAPPLDLSQVDAETRAQIEALYSKGKQDSVPDWAIKAANEDPRFIFDYEAVQPKLTHGATVFIRDRFGQRSAGRLCRTVEHPSRTAWIVTLEGREIVVHAAEDSWTAGEA